MALEGWRHYKRVREEREFKKWKRKELLRKWGLEKPAYEKKGLFGGLVPKQAESRMAESKISALEQALKDKEMNLKNKETELQKANAALQPKEQRGIQNIRIPLKTRETAQRADEIARKIANQEKLTPEETQNLRQLERKGWRPFIGGRVLAFRRQRIR